MSLKAKVEAIIYATEEPVTLDQLASLLGDIAVAEIRAEEAATTADDFEPRPSLFDGEQLSAGDLTKEQKYARDKAIKSRLTRIIDELTTDYAASDRGMEIRQVAGGYRMATKPEHHDVVVTFAKSLKPPIRLSLQALETLSVIAYKQPVTVPEISEIRGVDSSGVIATLLDRKLITTAGRKQVIGRPILYKTTKEFLLRFGLNDVSELPSMEEFEKLGEPQAELFPAAASATGHATLEPVTEAAAEPATAEEEKR
jgi:segregation and condensation protein B